MTKALDPIEPVSAVHAHDGAHPAACENCHTALKGAYCHVCGQHGHNPLKSFAHAIEEVFESFFHLDGRVFRSLRDLLIPGRIIGNYLNGQRVRYIPPLRLYVILSLFAFFLAHFVARGMNGLDINVDDNAYARLTTVAAVQALRQKQLAELDAGIAEMRKSMPPGAKASMLLATMQAGRDKISQRAERRIAELQGRAAVAAALAQPEVDVHLGPTPSAGSWRARLQQQWQASAAANVRHFATTKGAFAEAVASHLPAMLLVLVPAFALLLRVVYLRHRFGYLEHLVVSLYSHAMALFVAAVLILIILAARAWLAPDSAVVTWAAWLAWLAMAAYLLFTQKRVYGQRWPGTLLRYSITGGLYLCMALTAFAGALMLSLISGGGAGHA